MRMYWALYQKELRQHFQEYCILFFFLLVSIAAEYFNDPLVFRNTLGKLSWHYPKTSASFEIILMLTFYLLMFFAPVLLLYSLYDEKRAHTLSQNLSLPVPRYMLLLSKCLGILSILLLFDVIRGWVQLCASHNPFDFFSVTNMIELFFGQFSILGIVIAATGISFLLSRNRVIIGFTGAFLIISILGLFYRYFPRQAVTTWLYYTFHVESIFYFGYLLDLFLFPVIFAGTLFFVGLILYHQRAEV